MSDVELPQPGDSADQVIDKLNKLSKSKDGRKKANDYLTSDILQLDASVFREVYQHFATTGGASGTMVPPNSGEVWDRFQATGGTDSDYLRTTAEKRLANQVAGETVSLDLDANGKINASETKAFEDAKVKLAEKRAKENGTDPKEVKSQIDQMGLQPIPDVLLTYMGRTVQAGYDAGLEGKVSEIIRTWNEFNPDRPVTDKDGLYAVLKNANDPDVKSTMDAVFFGVEPSMQYTIALSNGQKVVIDADEFDVYRSTFGSDTDNRGALANLVRSADRIGIKSGSGQNAYQVLAALTKAEGMAVDTAYGVDRNFTGSADTAERRVNYRASQLDRLGLRFKEGQWIYHGNDTLAYIHALNPTLAAKASGDPKKLDQNDWRSFNQYLIDGGFDQDTLAKMGYYALGLDEWNNLAGGGASATTNTRTKQDPEAIKQAAKDLYRNLFAAEPTDAQLASIVSAVQATAAGAADDQNIDVSAQIRKQLEGNAQYSQLYGKKPAGMTEEEYQGQFRAGAATMLGNQAADPTTIRSGMRTGDYQTTVGAVAGSQKAWGNSTFRGRLAQAAALVAENT